ncbi:MAG TPA: glycosyltransferase family 2 protein [Bacteroidales bacterium]|nr:glycosyltransferase family 2 protein [Bacteroidales bacterium]
MYKPLISALTPTYNRENLIRRAIDSVLTQTYSNIELVIVDNCSTDSTEEIIKSYKDDRIRYIKLDKNYGHIVSRNRCIEEVKGEYFAFCDSDDEWLPEFIEKLYNKFIELNDEKVGAIYTEYMIHDDIGHEKILMNKTMPTGNVYEKLLTSFTPSGFTNFLFKTSAFKSIGLLDPKASGFDDHDALLRLARNYHFETVHEPLMIRHEHGSSQIAKDITFRYDHIKNFLELWGDEMIRVGGKENYINYRNKRIFSITKNTIKNPPQNYRKIFGKLFKNLSITGLNRPGLFFQSIIIFLVGPRLFKRMKKRENLE